MFPCKEEEEVKNEREERRAGRMGESLMLCSSGDHKTLTGFQSKVNGTVNITLSSGFLCYITVNLILYTVQISHTITGFGLFIRDFLTAAM